MPGGGRGLPNHMGEIITYYFVNLGEDPRFLIAGGANLRFCQFFFLKTDDYPGGGGRKPSGGNVNILFCQFRGGSRIPCRKGHQPSRTGQQPSILTKIFKNRMELRKFRAVWGHVPGRPLLRSATAIVSEYCMKMKRI